eukprot:2431092-Alexandrium_andersonii.AAC.1
MWPAEHLPTGWAGARVPTAGRRSGNGPRTRRARRAHRPPKLTLGGVAVVHSEASPVRVSALLVQ